MALKCIKPTEYARASMYPLMSVLLIFIGVFTSHSALTTRTTLAHEPVDQDTLFKGELPVTFTGTLIITTSSGETFLVVDALTGASITLSSREVQPQGISAVARGAGRAAFDPRDLVRPTVGPAIATVLILDEVRAMALGPDQAALHSELPVSGDMSWSPQGEFLIVPQIIEDAGRSLLASAYVWRRSDGSTETIALDPAGTVVVQALWSPRDDIIALVHASPTAQAVGSGFSSLSTITPWCWRSDACVLRPLIDGSEIVSRAVWHPDGQTLIAISIDAQQSHNPIQQTFAVGRINVDTSEHEILLTNHDIVQFLIDTGVIDAEADTSDIASVITDVAVSPDGRYIAFLFPYIYSNSSAAREVELIVLDLAKRQPMRTNVLRDLSPGTLASGLAWGPPLPEGVLPTPPPTPTE